MIVVGTGSRHAQRARKEHTTVIWVALLGIHREHVDAKREDMLLIHGNCKGVDDIMAAYATHLGWGVQSMPAQWQDPCRVACTHGDRKLWISGGGTYCPQAGTYRNQEMINRAVRVRDARHQNEVEAHDIICLAFPLAGAANKGTGDCCLRARTSGIPVHPHPLPELPPPGPPQAAGMGLPTQPAVQGTATESQV